MHFMAPNHIQKYDLSQLKKRTCDTAIFSDMIANFQVIYVTSRTKTV